MVIDKRAEPKHLASGPLSLKVLLHSTAHIQGTCVPGAGSLSNVRNTLVMKTAAHNSLTASLAGPYRHTPVNERLAEDVPSVACDV